MTINAIETRYAGCRFRSRLEARWAVAFDTTGVRWEYEPQGYQIVDHAGSIWSGPYLPDFYLPAGKIWVEIKGDPTLADVRQVVAAAIPHGGLPGGAVILGGPFSRDGVACEYLSFHKGDVWWRGAIVANDSGDFYENVARKVLAGWREPIRLNQYAPLSLAAISAARSARFEHGERG